MIVYPRPKKVAGENGTGIFVGMKFHLDADRGPTKNPRPRNDTESTIQVTNVALEMEVGRGFVVMAKAIF